MHGDAPAANNNSPKFVTLVRAKYKFEEQQNLLFRLYDVDTALRSRTERIDLSAQDHIGDMECKLSQIMGGRGASHTGPIVRVCARVCVGSEDVCVGVGDACVRECSCTRTRAMVWPVAAAR
jgi:hypothetical protein